MMSKLKKIISLINLLFISLSITLFFSYTYFNSDNFSAHEILNSNIHSFLFSSNLNDHHDTHETHFHTNDDPENHVHKHRHSENEKEHSHKHLNIISFSEIVINKIAYIEFYPIEIYSILHNTNNIKYYDSYILEILKPPIYT
jgi:Ca2+/H+ antiporter